jgi:hypothetical protein
MSAKLIGYVMYALAFISVFEVFFIGSWWNMTYILLFLVIGTVIIKLSDLEFDESEEESEY